MFLTLFTTLNSVKKKQMFLAGQFTEKQRAFKHTKLCLRRAANVVTVRLHFELLDPRENGVG